MLGSELAILGSELAILPVIGNRYLVPLPYPSWTSNLCLHISFNKSATSALCWLRTTLKLSFVIYPSVQVALRVNRRSCPKEKTSVPNIRTNLSFVPSSIIDSIIIVSSTKSGWLNVLNIGALQFANRQPANILSTPLPAFSAEPININIFWRVLLRHTLALSP